MTDKVITLIHGTFASEAEWPQIGSDFQKELAAHVDGDVKYEQFIWSGTNGHSARFQAGEELQDHIEQVAAENPGAEQYMVCHSHGGNVAYYAMRDAHIAAKVNGIVAMATPYIQASRRSLWIPQLFLTVGLPFLLSFLVIQFFFKSNTFLNANYVMPLLELRSEVQLFARKNLPFLVDVFVEFLALLLLYAPLAILPILISVWPVRNRMNKAQKKFFARFQTPPIPSEKVLTVNTANDEVRWLLGSLTWFTELLHMLSRSTLHLMMMGFVAPILLYIMLRQFWPTLCEIGLFNSTSQYQAFETVNATLLISTVFVSVVLWVLIQPIVLFAPKIARSHPLAMGWESAWANWLVKIVPAWGPDTLQERFAEIRFKAKDVPAKFNHNFMYYDLSFLPAVAEWINTKNVTPSDRIKPREKIYSAGRVRHEFVAALLATGMLAAIFYFAVLQTDYVREVVNAMFEENTDRPLPRCPGEADILQTSAELSNPST